MSAPFKAAGPPCRNAILGLADVDGEIPDDATVADLLAWAIVPDFAEDVVIGLIDAVRADLTVLALHAGIAVEKEVLQQLVRRLRVAVLLLDMADGRTPIPVAEPPAEEEEG